MKHKNDSGFDSAFLLFLAVAGYRHPLCATAEDFQGMGTPTSTLTSEHCTKRRDVGTEQHTLFLNLNYVDYCPGQCRYIISLLDISN